MHYKCYKTIALEDVSQVTDPVVNFEKSDDSKDKIVYLKGKEYLETEMTIELN